MTLTQELSQVEDLLPVCSEFTHLEILFVFMCLGVCLHVDVCYLQRTEEGIKPLELELQVVERPAPSYPHAPPTPLLPPPP